jgi:hypothetical protein
MICHRMYREEVEAQMYPFFNSALDAGEWSQPRPCCFAYRKEIQYPLYRRLRGPQGCFGWLWLWRMAELSRLIIEFLAFGWERPLIRREAELLPALGSRSRWIANPWLHSLMTITWLGSSTSYCLKWGSRLSDCRTMSAPNIPSVSWTPGKLDQIYLKHWNWLSQ